MALDNNQAPQQIQIGERITKGLGAGANPEIGRIAMEEDRERITAVLEGSDMLFITAGMGGGTGTGGAPVIAEIARELGILTVAIVTKPFLFEGKFRDRNAKKGIEELRRNVDTIIVIPNQKLLTIVDRNTALIDAFKTADDVLFQATKGISDLISVHGLVNLDFADVKTIMMGMGDALMGTGTAEGEDRSITAAEAAIHSPLLDDISIVGARGILINITGGEDMTLYDVSDATQVIHDAVGEDADANIIFGAVTDPEMNGKIRVTVIATGFNEEAVNRRKDDKVAFKPGVISANRQQEKRVEQMSISLKAPAKPQPVAQPRSCEEQPSEPQVQKQLEEEASLLAREQKESMPQYNDVEQEQQTDAPAASISADEVRLNMQEAQQPRTEQNSGEDHKPVFAPDMEERGLRLERDTGSFEFPAFLKKEQLQKEAQVFVSKGRVITHYEDDMDVPTFLRKQMQ
jgi:cell division protein FtsZ